MDQFGPKCKPVTPYHLQPTLQPTQPASMSRIERAPTPLTRKEIAEQAAANSPALRSELKPSTNAKSRESVSFQQEVTGFGSSARLEVLSPSHTYVDVKSMTAWLPVRSLRIRQSDFAVGEDNRVISTDSYDLREVTFTTDGLTKWLKRNRPAMLALQEAVGNPRRSARFERLLHADQPQEADGPTHVRMDAASIQSLSARDSTMVFGSGRKVEVNNTYRVRCVKVDLLDCLRQGWIPLQGFLDALAESAPGDKTAQLIRDGSREVVQADIKAVMAHAEGSTGAARTSVSGLGYKKTVGHAVGVVGPGNTIVQRVTTSWSGRTTDKMTNGLSDVSHLLGLDALTADPDLSPPTSGIDLSPVVALPCTMDKLSIEPGSDLNWLGRPLRDSSETWRKPPSDGLRPPNIWP